MIALAAATAIWTAGFLLATSGETLEQKALFVNIAYLGSMSVPVTWFIFSLKYTVGDQAVTRGHVLLLCIVPLAITAMIWTNPWHHLMWYDEYLAQSGPFLVTIKTYGPLFWVALTYNYLLVFAGSFILIRRLFTGALLFRGQAIALIVAVCLPLLWNMIYVFDLIPLPRKDLTPVMFAISGIAIVLGLMRLNMFRIVPFAYKYVIQQLNNGILIFDNHDCLVDANQAILKIIGADKKIVGRSLDELLPLSPLFEKLKFNEFGMDDFQLRVSNKVFFLELETIVMKNNRGRHLGWLAILHDVTDRRKMQEQMMIHDRFTAIGQLTSGVAHELNNPLTSVIGFSELLRNRDLPDDTKRDLEIIGREARRTTEIVKNLLTFARRHPQLKEPISLNEHIRSVMELRAYEHNVNNIRVITRLAPDLPQITGNGFQLQQVILNIIINAEFFMTAANKQGTLSISTESIPDYVRITISDDGPGIPPDNLPSLFTPFFTTKDVGEGTGLGLSICYGIITEHGGRIRAENLPGNGASFIIDLPVN
jgi:PAS domain S-box-containing protein